jgi:DNA polymerase-3 subunit epsilon
VHPKAQKIHGLSDEFLKNKPVFGDIVEEFLEFTIDHSKHSF